MNKALTFENLGKQFRRYRANQPFTLQEAVLRGGLLHSLLPRERFWALRHVNLSVPPGRVVGIVGANGAGKSTLLHLLGGVLRPDEGRVHVQGKIGALFDLGVGFHPELTGRENVMISGVIGGLTRREVLDRFDEMVEFAELGPFIDSPLRTYSSGMQMRLGFAVAAFTDPEVLLVDEVLAVGDLAFQRKCLDRIAEFRRRRVTILVVSHDAALVRELCDEVLWLRGGEQAAYGQAKRVMDEYVSVMSSETRRITPREFASHWTATGTELQANKNRFGSFELQITGVRLLGVQGNSVAEIAGGEPLSVEIKYSALKPIEGPIFGVTIRRTEGDLICFDANTLGAGLILPTVGGNGRVVLVIERIDLARGSYWVDVGVYRQDWSSAYDYHWQVYPLQVCALGESKAVLNAPLRWEFHGDAVISS